jgi:hypothetical protein
MQANMRATGRSFEEISAALIQLFLNCPAADPDEPGREVDIDEFAHTVVEQRARRDQQRVLEALAKCDQERALAALQAKEDAPAQAMAANDRPNGGPRVPLMEVVDFCVAPSAMLDSGAASSLTAHPPYPAERRRWHRCWRCKESSDPRHRHRGKLLNREPADSRRRLRSKHRACV